MRNETRRAEGKFVETERANEANPQISDIHLPIVYDAIFFAARPQTAERSPFFSLSSVSLFYRRHRCGRSSAHALSSRRDYDARTKTNLIAFPLCSIWRAREHEYGAYVPSDLRGARIGDVQQPREMLGRPIRSINTCALNVWELQSDRSLDDYRPVLLTRPGGFTELDENNFRLALSPLVKRQSTLANGNSFSLTFY